MNRVSGVRWLYNEGYPQKWDQKTCGKVDDLAEDSVLDLRYSNTKHGGHRDDLSSVQNADKKLEALLPLI